MHRFGSPLLALALLVPLGVALVPDKQPPPARQLVYARTAGGVTVVDANTGDTVLQRHGALQSGDGFVLVTAHADEQNHETIVDAVTPEDGSSIWYPQHLDGSLAVRAVSWSGERVALMPIEKEHANGNGLYRPESRDHTTIVLARFDGGGPKTFDLAANVEPEAFSADGTALFVIEYSPPLHPDRYRVARVDLTTGALGDVFTNEKELQDSMRGIAYTQAAAPDGHRLYTLYQKPNGETFVHVLDLVNQSANCVDLPEGFGEHPEALAITTDGDGQVIVVDGAARRIATVDPVGLRVVDTSAYRGLKATTGHVVATAGYDGGGGERLFVGTARRVVELDPEGHSELRTIDLDQPASAIHMVGNMVFVATRHQLLALDLRSRYSVDPALEVDLGGIRSIGDSSATTSKWSVQCAC